MEVVFYIVTTTAYFPLQQKNITKFDVDFLRAEVSLKSLTNKIPESIYVILLI